MCQKYTKNYVLKMSPIPTLSDARASNEKCRMMVRSIFFEETAVCWYVPLDHCPIGWWHQEDEIWSVVDTSRQNKKIIFLFFL